MQYRYAKPLACIALPLAGMLSIGCGIFTFPGDGVKAAMTNAQFIHLEVDIVDQDGLPVNDVTVRVTRHSLGANMILPGLTHDEKPDLTRVVNEHFTYDSLGNCAVSVQFSKTGYSIEKQTYAKVDQVSYDPARLFGPPGPDTISCVNIEKNPHQKVVLTKLVPG